MSVRIALTYASLVIVLCTFVAFISGPLWGLRLDYEKGQQLQLIQIIIPTFLSFLLSAVIHATSGGAFPEPRGQKGKILSAITIGSLAIFSIGTVVATVVYYFSANGAIEYGRLDFDKYSFTITLLLGVLAATMSGISAYI